MYSILIVNILFNQGKLNIFVLIKTTHLSYYLVFCCKNNLQLNFPWFVYDRLCLVFVVVGVELFIRATNILLIIRSLFKNISATFKQGQFEKRNFSLFEFYIRQQQKQSKKKKRGKWFCFFKLFQDESSDNLKIDFRFPRIFFTFCENWKNLDSGLKRK